MRSAGSRQWMVLTFPYSSFSLTHFPGERWRYKRRVWLESCRIESTWWRMWGPVSFSPCYRLPVTLNAKWAVSQWLCSWFKSNPVWSRPAESMTLSSRMRAEWRFFFFPFFLMSFKVEGRWKIMFSISFQHHQFHSWHVMALPNHICTFSSFL